MKTYISKEQLKKIVKKHKIKTAELSYIQEFECFYNIVIEHEKLGEKEIITIVVLPLEFKILYPTMKIDKLIKKMVLANSVSTFII